MDAVAVSIMHLYVTSYTRNKDLGIICSLVRVPSFSLRRRVFSSRFSTVKSIVKLSQSGCRDCLRDHATGFALFFFNKTDFLLFRASEECLISILLLSAIDLKWSSAHSPRWNPVGWITPAVYPFSVVNNWTNVN